MSIKKHTLYDIFWFLVILFPLIICVASYISDNVTVLTLHDAVGEVVDFSTGSGINAVYDSLCAVFTVDEFSSGGLSTDVISYIAYFVLIELIRLYVEFILLLPRICRQFMNFDKELL